MGHHFLDIQYLMSVYFTSLLLGPVLLLPLLLQLLGDISDIDEKIVTLGPGDIVQSCVHALSRTRHLNLTILVV